MKKLTNKPQSEMTAHPRKYPQGYFKDKGCKLCDEVFSPQAPSHMYCSDRCKSYAEIDAYYRKNYSTSYADVLMMREHQDYKCAICRGEGFNMNSHIKSSLNVDHCHDSGVVRGLLCHNCNRALGLLQDDVGILKTAIKYIESATTIETQLNS